MEIINAEQTCGTLNLNLSPRNDFSGKIIAIIFSASNFDEFDLGESSDQILALRPFCGRVQSSNKIMRENESTLS
jgi:hypothetical protein